MDASSPQFMATSGQRLLAKLARILQGLDCGGLQEAILKLQAAADCVPGAPEAMEAPLHALQARQGCTCLLATVRAFLGVCYS